MSIIRVVEYFVKILSRTRNYVNSRSNIYVYRISKSILNCSTSLRSYREKLRKTAIPKNSINFVRFIPYAWVQINDVVHARSKETMTAKLVITQMSITSQNTFTRWYNIIIVCDLYFWPCWWIWYITNLMNAWKISYPRVNIYKIITALELIWFWE